MVYLQTQSGQSSFLERFCSAKFKTGGLKFVCFFDDNIIRESAFTLQPFRLNACSRGVNPGWVGGRDPQILGRGGGGLRGVVGGREILLYLIMYRKYVRKW